MESTRCARRDVSIACRWPRTRPMRGQAIGGRSSGDCGAGARPVPACVNGAPVRIVSANGTASAITTGQCCRQISRQNCAQSSPWPTCVAASSEGPCEACAVGTPGAAAAMPLPWQSAAGGVSVVTRSATTDATPSTATRADAPAAPMPLASNATHSSARSKKAQHAERLAGDLDTATAYRRFVAPTLYARPRLASTPRRRLNPARARRVGAGDSRHPDGSGIARSAGGCGEPTTRALCAAVARPRVGMATRWSPASPGHARRQDSGDARKSW